jgi:hypothetical protein
MYLSKHSKIKSDSVYDSSSNNSLSLSSLYEYKMVKRHTHTHIYKQTCTIIGSLISTSKRHN